MAVAGVAGGITAALMYLRKIKPHANVAILEPFYTYHFLEVERAFTRNPVVISPINGLEANLPELKRLVEAGEVHGVIVTNPLNPSGHVFTETEVQFILGLSDSHDLFVIFDECYLDMVFNGKKHNSPLGDVRDNVVCCRGFSKCMGCQSWRVGYAISSASTLKGIMAMGDPLYICANWTQHALGKYFAEHVEDFKEHVVKTNELMQGNWFLLRDAFVARFGWVPVEPDGTMYGMFKHSDESDIKACERALQAGVGICPGSAFFAPKDNTGFVRIHCGVTRERAQEVADILAKVSDA